MNKNLLLKLLAHTHRSVAEVKSSMPDLFAALQGLALDEAREKLTAAFADAAPELQKRIAALHLVDVAPTAIPGLVRKALAANLTPEQADDGGDRLAELEAAGAFTDPLAQGDAVVGELPLVQEELELARVYIVVELAKLDDARAAKLVLRVRSLAELDDDALAQAVAAGELNEATAKDLGLSSSLYQLLNDDHARAAAVKGARIDGVPGGRLTSLRDLAALDAKAWRELLQRANVALPAGVDPGAFARSLADRVAALYASDAFVRRLPTVDAKAFADDVRKQSPLVARLVHLYPGLRLDAVIADPKLTPEAKAEAVARRVGLIGAIATKHADKELLSLDYAPDGDDLARLDLAGLGLSDDEQRMAVSTLKAFQRVHALTGDVDHAHAVLAAGIASAASAATMHLDDFKAATGLDDATARKHHARARSTLGRATSAAAAAMDVMRGGFDHLRVANVGPDAKDMLRKFDGFSDLFGSQDYCKCEHCRSVLGPAAYFVDLMAFVDHHVRNRSFRGDLGKHPLNLRTRRPDLWHLPLTCANTDTLVPTLEIANHVLENYIAGYVAEKLGTTVDLKHRTEVESLVYEKTLAQVAGSFGQPFVLPLERLTAYLRHFKRDRDDIARALGASTDQVARAALGLSVIEHHAITRPDVDREALARLYDVAFEPAPSGAAAAAGGAPIAPVEVEKLLRAMGVSRAELADIIAAHFVAAGAGATRIVAAKRTRDSVQNDTEEVRGLTPDALDRMHRFTRLWRRTAWNPRELDLVLVTLDATALDAATLGRVVAFRRARHLLGASLEETCALVGEIPRFAVAPDGTPLVDQLFNPPGSGAAQLPDPKRMFLHPSLRLPGSATAPDPVLPRLLAGLRVSDDDLLLVLAKHLHRALGIDPDAADENARRFALGGKHLALLYRHARLAERLKLSIPHLFQLLELAGVGAVGGLDDLTALLDFHAWWRTSGYTLDDLGLLLGKTVLAAAGYPKAPEVAAQVIVDAAGALAFADTVFAVALGVSEEVSRQILTANSASVVKLDEEGSKVEGSERYRLADDFDPAAVPNIPTGLDVDAGRVRDVLRGYHASAVVPLRLSAALRISADKVAALIHLAGATPTGSAIAQALRALPAGSPPVLPPEAQPLVAFVAALLPLTVLFKHPAFDGAAIDFVRAHGAAFGLDHLPTVDAAGIRGLSIYARLAPAPTEIRFTGDPPQVDAADLRRALAHFDPASGFSPGVDDDLARVLRTTKLTIASLRRHVALPGPAASALDQLARCAHLARQLGIGGQALTHAVAATTADGDLHARAADEYAQLDQAADALLGAFRAKYPDPTELADKLEPYEDKLRSHRRDALTDYLVHSYHPAFKDRRAIYEYFLIDVDLEGCARTSRVVAATNSVQLYFQRCLMDLEQDRRGGTGDVHVQIDKEAADEWTWRKAYRVWEANRKVFLYPESYLEPDLRDDKTPLFEALEAELLQKQIDHQSVLDAYTSFMDGFEEVGKLTIAGAFYDDDNDTLHLLGVTASDPPKYYYRAVEGPFGSKGGTDAVWHPWREIGVQIPVRHASPVVYQQRLHVFWIELRTQSVNEVAGGGSTFMGYRHKLTLKHTSLRLDGKWTAAQEISLPRGMEDSDHMRGVVTDYFDTKTLKELQTLKELKEQEDSQALKEQRQRQISALRRRTLYARLQLIRRTKNPVDDYTLTGANWESVYPEVDDSSLVVVARNFRLVAGVSLFRRSAWSLADVTPARRIHASKHTPLLSTKGDGSTRGLYYGTLPTWYAAPNAFANLVLEDERIAMFDGEYGLPNDSKLQNHVHKPRNKIAELSGVTDLLAISGSIEDAIVQAGADAILVERHRHGAHRYRIQRLGTTLTDRLARRLFSRGVNALLQLKFQQNLKEADPPLSQLSRIEDATNKGKLDFTGPYGVYYREIFFHIPWIIADHLNSQGRFADAQRWYHHIFDPTADGKGVDRVWRYLELRDATWPTMRDMLHNKQALRAYERDPFNPHAIARLRLSAYAKSIVMKYIDNLLDWGDRRFAEFTMESVNEATMLYSMAADILGERPYEAGDCGEAADSLTFEQIHPSMTKDSPFLIELESHATGKRPAAKTRRAALAARYTVDPEALSAVRTEVPLATPPAPPKPSDASDDSDNDDDDDRPAARGGPAWTHTSKAGWSGAKGASPAKPGVRALAHDAPDPARVSPAAFGWSVFRQIGPAFCVPPNDDLLAYWDRVEDRLYKIHHCLDLHGRRRDLALFAPEIDPRLLVKMKAAGLSLEDVTDATSGDLPPYRFAYLIEKAKSFASALQSFGSALLSALEKKDAEELARLRLVHEQNIAKMTTQLKQWEIDTAQESIDAAQKQKAAAEFRRDHYKDLMDQGLSAWETTGQVARHTVSGIYLLASATEMVASILGYVPQTGSPFAMKYGGVELSGGAARFAGSINATAKAAEAVAASAGVEGTYDRRREDWKFQRDIADHDVQQQERQIKIAEIRKQIAEKSLAIHEKTIEQTEELHAFYADKFTSFGLYKWMATTLQRTYRQAYANALSLARVCQAAFEFERGDAPGIHPGAGSWDGTHAGLLAGDKLLLDLQALERRFIETNYRTLEVEQSFPLTQIDPAALLRLRETGECQFDIPEIFFDLSYPGHYRRRIKAVRLTIPCITGPYTNVGATLTLMNSQVRAKPHQGVKPVPLQRTISIATSKAQNDAGVFELTFHDERYMPFEGAGGVSAWKLTLPRSFRPFDYETISDVVLTINYTALADDTLRETVEKLNATAEQAIVNALKARPLARVFSLRQEFPVAYRALVNSAPGTAVSFEIKDWHFPAFVTASGRTIQVTAAKLALKTGQGMGTSGVRLLVDGETVEGFAGDDALGGLPAKAIKGQLARVVKGAHTVAVGAAGGLGPEGPQVGSGAALDQGKAADVLLYVEYKVVMP